MQKATSQSSSNCCNAAYSTFQASATDGDIDERWKAREPKANKDTHVAVYPNTNSAGLRNRYPSRALDGY